MQRTLALSVFAVVFASTLGLAVAAEDSPRPAVPSRGTEGPDVRHTMAPHRSGCDGIRRACSADSRDVDGLAVR
jgi:hypothetical protein